MEKFSVAAVGYITTKCGADLRVSVFQLWIKEYIIKVKVGKPIRIDMCKCNTTNMEHDLQALPPPPRAFQSNNMS